ncbi:hypothetical protein H6G41_24140 [Tolypothrix sp. FACHB-123]|uniref:hypothetical protein n=1 Tax=Tolypothrix sp. FACHB-123 TaxID=2692868 RepID=UPI0016848A39|nr:hypothetical protein [Tolypothrix sp. FACHB-123]MBD2357663.1 hypothetical protein [Tolypothrix sp. FACHB-123]
MSKQMRMNFRWRYQPRNEMDAFMLDYIAASSVRDTTEMILLALRAFWLPIAVVNSKEIDEATKQRVVTDACYTLLHQLRQIHAAAGLSNSQDLRLTLNPERSPSSTDSKSNTQTVQTPPTIEEQKQMIGQFDYDINSFENW